MDPTQPPTQEPIKTPIDASITPKPKSNWTLIILSILSAILLVTIVFLSLQNQKLQKLVLNPLISPTNQIQPPTPKPISSIPPDETEDWNTYTSQDFSFKYPSNLTQDRNGLVGGTFLGNPKIVVSFADQSTIREGTDAPFDGFTIYRITHSENSIPDYLKKEILARKDSPRGILSEKIQNIFIGGKPSFYIDAEQNIRQYFIPTSNDDTILFSTVRQNDEFLPTLDQILSTFKFTDSGNNMVIPADWKEYSATDPEFGIKTIMSMPPGFSFKFTGSEFTIQNDSDATELWDYSTSITTGSNNVLKNYYDGGSRREWYKRYLDGEFSANTIDKKTGDIMSVAEITISNTSYLRIVVNTLSRGTQTHYVYLQNDIIHIIKPISDVAETSKAKFPQYIGLSLYSLKSIQIK